MLQKMVSKEIEMLNQALQEERFRSERLEEQINDLTELHQNEVENLKQTICDMEEKVQYQSEERLRDIQEMLESCQTKVNYFSTYFKILIGTISKFCRDRFLIYVSFFFNYSSI